MFHVKHRIEHTRTHCPILSSMSIIPLKEIPQSNVSRETFELVDRLFEKKRERFSFLSDKWEWWNRSVNLFSRNTDKDALDKHIYHSLILVAHTMVSPTSLVVDAGTGGGLPGLPMAIAMPETNFALVDKVQKKCLAVRNIIRSLGLKNTQVYHSDIARISFEQPYRVVSKHAFPVKAILAALDDKNWTEVAMLKGREVLSELDEELLVKYRFSFLHLDLAMDVFFKDKGVLLIHKSNDRILP